MTDHTRLITQMLILCAAAVFFGLLHIVAALSQVKKGLASQAMMLTGGMLMIVAMVLCIVGSPLDWASALIGGGLICFNALLNGQRSGKIHWQHHLVRAAIVLALAAGFALL